MKKIALLHTVPSVYLSFKGQLTAAVEEELVVDSIVDEFLVTRAREMGYFTPECREKLLLDLLSLQAQKPDVIIVTCSSLSTFVLEYANVLSVPVVTIDKRMCQDAAEMGTRIAVLATAPTALQPVKEGIEKAAAAMGKKVEVSLHLDEEAMNQLKKGNVEAHDAILATLSEEAKDADVIVLAQASMATGLAGVQKATGKPVLTSPGSCISEAKELLYGGRR